MAHEEKKDFNKMLLDDKDMPKIQTVTDQKTIERYGGDKMYFASPRMYDELIKQIPAGKLVTTGQLRSYFAAQAGADFTDPMTAGIFTQIVAWASYQRTKDGQTNSETPYWRVLKTDGELNPKYPEAFDLQIEKLKAEGHEVVKRGRTNIRYFVPDYEQSLYEFK